MREREREKERKRESVTQKEKQTDTVKRADKNKIEKKDRKKQVYSQAPINSLCSANFTTKLTCKNTQRGRERVRKTNIY